MMPSWRAAGRSLRNLEQEVEKLQEQLLRSSEANEKSEGYGELLKERRRNLEQNREQLMQTLGSVGERSEGRQREPGGA